MENDDLYSPEQVDTSLSAKKRTRPLKPIDEDKLRDLLAVNMPVKRIAQYFNVTSETLYNRYGDLIIESNVEYEAQLRKAQLRTALDGNPTMLIWLGKQYLGQRDLQEVAIEDKRPSVSEITFTPLRAPDAS